MGQKKLVRFAEIKNFDNVLEFPEEMPGKWNSFFKNDQPLTLELACGKGEYALGLGRLYPHRNFIGLDLKGNRIWKGAKTAINEGLTNVAFVRTEIDLINKYFDKNEVAEIWITFPDPQLKGAKIRKRLTHPKFLRFYQQILKDDGTVNLKTDSPNLYEFTKKVIEIYNLETITDYNDVYSLNPMPAELAIKTHYEGLDISGSHKIHYLKFKINKELPIEKDHILRELYVQSPLNESNG